MSEEGAKSSKNRMINFGFLKIILIFLIFFSFKIKSIKSKRGGSILQRKQGLFNRYLLLRQMPK